MPDNKRINRRRYSLYLHNPYCFWCDRLTLYLPAVSSFHLKATVDHIRDAYTKLLGIPETINLPDNETTVLACYECNQQRGKLRQQAANNLLAAMVQNKRNVI